MRRRVTRWRRSRPNPARRTRRVGLDDGAAVATQFDRPAALPVGAQHPAVAEQPVGATRRAVGSEHGSIVPRGGLASHGPFCHYWLVIEQATSKPIAAMMAGWANHGHGSLAQRLAYGLRRLIDAGMLGPGSRLPPERRLADELAVSRSTVTVALDLLRSEGVLTSRQGRGTFVAAYDDLGTDEAANRMAVYLLEGAGGIDLAVGNPADVSHLPPVSIDIADLLASGAGAGFQPLGLPSLRSAIADMHTALGVHTDVEEVHVTSGAHQAISLAVAALAGPREPVAAAHPRLPGVLRHPRGPRPTVRAAARRSGGHHARVAHRRPRRRGPGRVRAGRRPRTRPASSRPRRACAPSPRSSTNARRSSSRTRRSPSWCSPAGRRPTSPGCAGGRRWCRSARSARCCGPGCAWDGCAAPSP